MKRRLIQLPIILALLFSMMACINEDDLKTEGELNAEKISKLVNEKNINQVSIYTWEIDYMYSTVESKWQIKEDGEMFAIESPFILINSETYYNLSRLERFEYKDRELSIYLK